MGTLKDLENHHNNPKGITNSYDREVGRRQFIAQMLN